MSETDADLYTRTKALLEPGDIELAGCIVHTTLGGQEDLEMHELTVAINEVIADHAGKGESYIEAGNDDTNFSSNQFQGLTLDDEAFVWGSASSSSATAPSTSSSTTTRRTSIRRRSRTTSPNSTTSIA